MKTEIDTGYFRHGYSTLFKYQILDSIKYNTILNNILQAKKISCRIMNSFQDLLNTFYLAKTN